MPRIIMVAIIVHSEVVKAHANRAKPTPNRERIRVLLWFKRDETKPEPREPIKTPTEPIRKIEPDWLKERPRSRLIVGIKGAKINLLIKVRKKMIVRKMIFPIMSLKDAGTGHSFVIKMYSP